MLPFRPKNDRPKGLPPEPTGNGQRAGADGASSAKAIRTDGGTGRHHHLQERLLLAIAGHPPDRSSETELRLVLDRLVEELSREQAEPLSMSEREELFGQVLDEVFGYGPIERLMRDHEITDILINGPRQLFIEKRGQLQACPATFRDDGHLLQVIQRMIGSTSRR